MIMINLILGLIALIVILCLCFYGFVRYVEWSQARYYIKRGVPFVKGNFSRIITFFTGKLSMFDLELLMYKEALEKNSPYVGLSDLMGLTYLIMDLDLSRTIYVKDADHFIDRRKFSTRKADVILTKMLIGLEGDHWKGMRSKMSPTFTTGKIRKMFEIFESSSNRMCKFLETQLDGGSSSGVEFCKAFSKYAIDVIASSAFGIDSKTYDQEPGKVAIFEEMAGRLNFKISIKMFFQLIISSFLPKIADMFGFQTFDAESENYFKRVITSVLEHRRKTGERREDFLQLMLDAQTGLLKHEENSKETVEVMTGTTETKPGDSAVSSFTESGKSIVIDDHDIVANCILFLIGGFDTTQSLLIFSVYMLALEQDCQEKLRQEVNESVEANKGKLTYDGVNGMAYLDMFINETLRYLPPAGRTERLCVKDYKLPGENGPVIEKGTMIGLPIAGVHRNPNYYENPEKFDPERFRPEARSKMHPYSFAAFGHGPRNCIGMRFALTEVKTVVATLVQRFKLEPCSKTDIPMQFGNATTLKPKNGMWINITPIAEE